MISFIRGLVADTTENSVILEAGGIGYEIFMTGSSIEQASRSEGKVKIHTYFHVREDAMQLYGFLSRDDLEMFRLLLNVNGIALRQLSEYLPGSLQMNFVLQSFPMTSRRFPRPLALVRKPPRN